METTTQNSEWYNGTIEYGKTKWPTLKEMKFCYSQDQREITMSHSDNKRIGITFTEELVKRFDEYPEMLKALIEITEEVQRQCSIGSDPRFMPMLQKWQTAKQIIIKAEGGQ